MLQIEIPESEFYDERLEEFITTKATVLRLEHSLVSVSKWESKWRKPFLDPRNKKTEEEAVDYVRCMTLNQQVDPKLYLALTPENMEAINKYINEEQTATWFSNEDKPPNRDIVTSELIYYWMCAAQIPWEAQKWHLSRLLTLIRIASIKNAPEKKMSKSQILSRNRALNAARRKKYHTKG